MTRKKESAFDKRKSKMGYFAFALRKTDVIPYRIYLYRKIAFFYMKKNHMSYSDKQINLINKIFKQQIHFTLDPLVWVASIFYAVYRSTYDYGYDRMCVFPLEITVREKFSSIFVINKDTLSKISKQITNESNRDFNLLIDSEKKFR